MNKLNDIIGSIAVQAASIIADIIHCTYAFMVRYRWLLALAAILLIAIDAIIQIATYPTKP